MGSVKREEGTAEMPIFFNMIALAELQPGGLPTVRLSNEPVPERGESAAPPSTTVGSGQARPEAVGRSS